MSVSGGKGAHAGFCRIMAVEAKQGRKCLRCLEVCCSPIVYNLENVSRRTEAEGRGAVARILVRECRKGSAVGGSLAGLPTFASTGWSRISREPKVNRIILVLVSSVLLCSQKVGNLLLIFVQILPYLGNFMVDATRTMVRRQWLTKRQTGL